MFLLHSCRDSLQEPLTYAFSSYGYNLSMFFLLSAQCPVSCCSGHRIPSPQLYFSPYFILLYLLCFSHWCKFSPYVWSDSAKLISSLFFSLYERVAPLAEWGVAQMVSTLHLQSLGCVVESPSQQKRWELLGSGKKRLLETKQNRNVGEY